MLQATSIGHIHENINMSSTWSDLYNHNVPNLLNILNGKKNNFVLLRDLQVSPPQCPDYSPLVIDKIIILKGFHHSKT